MVPEHGETFLGALGFLFAGVVLFALFSVFARRMSWTGEGAAHSVARLGGMTLLLGAAVVVLLVGLWLLLASYSPNWGR